MSGGKAERRFGQTPSRSFWTTCAEALKHQRCLRKWIIQTNSPAGCFAFCSPARKAQVAPCTCARVVSAEMLHFPPPAERSAFARRPFLPFSCAARRRARGDNGARSGTLPLISSAARWKNFKAAAGGGALCKSSRLAWENPLEEAPRRDSPCAVCGQSAEGR